MKQRARIGVIGTSWWADAMHLPSLASHDGAVIAAICGRNRERAEAMAAKYGIPQVFTDYRQMIDRAGIDAVVISAPDDLHHEMTLAALDAGLHVMCEKPFAMSVAQAREMLDRAERAGVKHMICFTYRWLPLHRHVHRLVSGGYLGDPVSAELHFIGGFGRGTDYRWRDDATRCLGVLGDMGSHMIDLARWWFGDTLAVVARLRATRPRIGPDGKPIEPANDTAVLLAETRSGCHAFISVSSVAHVGDRGLEQRFVLRGGDGTVEATASMAGSSVRGVHGDQKQFEELPVPADLLAGIDPSEPGMSMLRRVFTEQPAGCRAFVDAILSDAPATPSFHDGLEVQKVLEAAFESDRRRRWVTV